MTLSAGIIANRSAHLGSCLAPNHLVQRHAALDDGGRRGQRRHARVHLRAHQAERWTSASGG